MKIRFPKNSAVILFLFIITFLFASCNKELSLERAPNSGTSSGTSVYTYSGAQTSCVTPIINGAYFVNTPVTAVNTIELQINVTKIGTYLITTSTINGIAFSASGTAITTGSQTIIFKATGKPLAKGSFSYTPGDYNGCTFSITVGIATVTNTATFTFPSAPNACANDTVYGTYLVGSALSATNRIKIPVNVTVAGDYSISTTTLNGISFNGAGTFTTTGVQSIILSGTGTPLLAGPFNYSPGSNGCSFLITVLPAAPPAVFTFPSAPNTCNPVTIKGSFVAGSALTATNTVALQVNVTKTGSYSITTNVINGISFTTTDVFTTTGLQTITLTGNGTPTTAGSFDFLPGNNSCAFSIKVTAATDAAVYALGSCNDLVVNGNYIIGQPLTTTNTINVTVIVSTAGKFSLVTNLLNGFSFGGSGSFPAAGSYKINLRGTGTPMATGTNAFTFEAPNSACAFNVVVADVAPVVSGTLTCKIDGVATTFNDRAFAQIIDLNGPVLIIDGFQAPANGQKVPEFELSVSNNNKSLVSTGTYNEHSFIPTSPTNLGYRIEIDYKFLNPDATTTLFNTSSNFPSFDPPYALSSNPPFLITITSVSATRVKGTFSGKLTNILEGSKIIKVITEGTFDEPIQ